MKVSELIEELKKVPQDAQVELTVADAKDTAFSRAEVKVSNKEGDGETGLVTISAFVWSDDEDAYAPWANND